MPTLRDRLLTPRVARAITSPGSILLLGVAGAAGMLLGGPLAAAVAGLGAYVGRVALAVPRGDPGDQVRPELLTHPWRQFVAETLQAQQRYRGVVSRTPSGPLRDRLDEIGRRIEDAVAESWRIAKRGQALEGGLATLDLVRVRAELAEAERSRAQHGSSPQYSDATVEALRSQLATAERLSRVSRDAADRLRLLDARLDEAVARAVELSLSGDHAQLPGLGSDVESLVSEMESLRQALDDTGGQTPTMGVSES